MNNYNFDFRGVPGAVLVGGLDYLQHVLAAWFEGRKLSQGQRARRKVVAPAAAPSQMEPCPCPAPSNY